MKLVSIGHGNVVVAARIVSVVGPSAAPVRRLREEAQASFAEFERSIIRERTRAGVQAAREQGRIGGRRPKLKPHQQKEIVKMVTSGAKTAADAARLFGVHPSTVGRIVGKAHDGVRPVGS